MSMSDHQTAEQNHCIMVANKSKENVARSFISFVGISLTTVKSY
jgi:hypothetical protein